jgi:LacI family gluconate utilization system Gnt-I transcriptional repressor
VGSAVGGFFLARGWQHVGIATGNDERALTRRDGFITTIGREAPTAYVEAPSSLERGRSALAELLAQEPRLQAVCCSSDQLAHGVFIEAMARGLRVPEDLAICGFGNADFSAHMVPSITTVHVDGPEIGRLAAHLIIARCRGETVAQPVIDVGFRMIERQTTGS